MQATGIIASSARRYGPSFLAFVVLTAALRRPIVEAIAMSPQHFASRFEPLASRDLIYVLALLPGVLAAPKAWARLHAGARASARLGLTLGAIALVSGSWSADSAASVGTIGMALMTAVALLGATTWFVSRDQHWDVAILGTLSLWLLASAWVLRYAAGWSRRQYSADLLGADWVGLFRFGNSLGEYAGITAIVAASAVLVALRERRWAVAAMTAALLQLAVLVVVQSGYTTGSIGLICAVVATMALVAARRLVGKRVRSDRRATTLAVGLCAATSLGLVGIILLGDQVSELLGKPPGLHRTRFWVEALTGARERPLVGWGWDGYMSDPAYGELFENWSRLDPHNFFLQVLLSAGIFAFGLVIAWTLHGLYLCGLAVSRGANPITFVALPVFMIVCLTATTIGVLNVYLIAVLAMVFVLAGEEATQRATGHPS